MGVKLQLLLGLFLFGSVCRSEDNTTNFANVSSEKLDSTRNLIEKLPKTDTQINLVNKDTQDSADVSQKYSKYPIGTDVHKNKTFSEENESNENNNKGRQDNSRSIDVEKLHSPDFHNNDYSSDNLKFLENTIRKASTKGYIDFSNFQLTTPKNSYFDAKFEEAKQKLEQEYEENTPEHFDDHHIEEGIDMDHHEHHLDDDVHIDTLFGDSNLKPNASIDYKEKTRISRNNTFDDNSEHNQFSVEKVQKLNFASEYNVTTSDEDESSRTEPDPEKPETTSSRGFLTSRKPVTLTKPPTSPSNHILSNKIESETIKAINSLTTEYPTTKRLKEKNEIVKEQSVEENKIIPIEITEPETTEQLTTENIEKVTNAATPIEQIKETTIYYEVPLETLTTREHEEQTTSNNEVHFSEETTFKINDDTTYRNDETTKINEILTTTESYFEATESSTVTSTTDQTTQQVTDEQTTYLPLDSTTTIGLDDTTTIVSKDDTTVATTDASKTEATTVALINETKQQTTIEEFADSTTESLIRISKSFSFEDRPTTTDQTETATETINIKLFSTKAIDEGRTTDKFPVVQNATEIETTTTMTTEVKTEIETSATSTTTEGTVTTLDYKQIKSNITHTTWLPETTAELNDTTSLPETNSSMPSTIDGTKFRNASATSEESTTYSASSTEEYTSDSSPGPDAGNIGGQEDNKGKIAAIVISTVGAVSLILLAGLLYIMRKRQKRFNYKQRCRPVSLDHYSVDNVSGFNSTRRKHERQSKRSYGNPAFDDPVAVTHPLNFPALAKFATNTEDIKAEFEEIPQITAKINELPEGCEIKNRYANVIPLPETRVFLQPIDGYPTSDYINANYVTGPKNTKGYYIACQGPMQNTVDDFWRMVWEQQTKVILMVTHLFENGVEKCVDYLPPSEVLDCNRLFGDFQVTLKKRDVKDKYIISNLQLKNMVSNSWREITHFWYLGWPEKGVPTEENSLIAFLIEARSYMKSSTLDKTAAANGNTNGPPKNEINPVVVHCSPGTGRTGVVIACDIAIREFEQTRLVDIPKIIYRIRRDRASAVQTKEQYMFIYKVVSLYATKLTGGALESF